LEKPNDSILDYQTHQKVCTEAKRILESSDSTGIFPTPIDQILLSANVVEIPNTDIDLSFLGTMHEKAKGALKSALSKVCGVYDAISRHIFVDRTLLQVRKNFIRLHEAGHAYMPWQSQTYTIIEECSQTLSADIADQFDVEANVFASEVLFQNDTFIQEANDHNFSIDIPVKMSKKYGASIYASIRQYVAKNHRCCAVLVLNRPKFALDHGFTASIRRVVPSKAFQEKFGSYKWPTSYTPDDELGKFIPLQGRKSSGMATLALMDDNGGSQEFIGEAFTNTYQVFILLHLRETLAQQKTILIP